MFKNTKTIVIPRAECDAALDNILARAVDVSFSPAGDLIIEVAA